MEEAELFNRLGLWVALAVVFTFLAAFFIAVLAARRRNQARLQAWLALGFTPVEPPEHLLAAVARLQPQAEGKLRLKNVLYRRISRGESYLFDVVDTGGSESSTTTDVLAVLSPSLEMPLFFLEPRLPLPGTAPGGKVSDFVLRTAQKMLDYAYGKAGLQRLDFSQRPVFNQNYAVIAQDEGAVRAFLTDARLARLAELPPVYRVRAAGDTFILDVYQLGRERETVPAAVRAQDAERLRAILER